MKKTGIFFITQFITFSLFAFQVKDSTELTRFEKQIVAYEKQDVKNFPSTKGIVFTGSSSVRMWNHIKDDLHPLPVINRGFGGSTIPEVNYYASRIIYPYQPQIVAIYAGDNDVAKGYRPKEILANYQTLVSNIHNHLPNTKIYFISIKPSPARWNLWPQMKKANQLIEQFSQQHDYLYYFDVSAPMINAQGTVKGDIFLDDNLHMNRAGYDLWTDVIKPELTRVFDGYNLWMPKIFNDQMVLQRNNQITVWGRANPGEEVKATIANKQATSTANNEGWWTISLPPMQQGGPYDLRVSDNSRELNFEDVLIGDVWIASGQSNMEWNLSWQVDNYEEEIRNADYPEIRLFTVPRNVSHIPLEDVSGGQWERCGPENAGDFSAVAYFFSRKIHLDKNVPVGIIQSAWGGTPAESWTSMDMLHTLPDFKGRVENFRENPENYQAKIPENERKARIRDSLYRHAEEGLNKNVHKVTYNDEQWKVMIQPDNWQDSELANYDGFVWFRKKIQLPADFQNKDLYLALGRIIHQDKTYFNGEMIGQESNNQTFRNYKVPASLVKSGENIIAVRVLNRYGQGGFVGIADSMYIKPAEGDQKISLADAWKYNKNIEPEIPKVENFAHRLAGLFNAMIHPLMPLSIKGFIWYQGESNASRAYQYRSLFPTMIEDWRVRFNQGYLPFMYVQLANFMQRKNEPVDDAWAELREAQLMTLDYPKTGMAVTIDIGDAEDIHPRNKQDVGNRLALAAYKIAYEDDIVHSGPLYDSMEIKGNAIYLHFSNTGSGLTTSDGEAPKSFSIAGKNKEFHWGRARIVDHNTIMVESSKVEDPVAVRYAWQSNPEVNLYNKEGLPASPFRTDQWKGITE